MKKGSIGVDQYYFASGQKKMEYRRTPTFVNLKSNTMKNTVQRYNVSIILQWISSLNSVKQTLI